MAVSIFRNGFFVHYVNKLFEIRLPWDDYCNADLEYL